MNDVKTVRTIEGKKAYDDFIKECVSSCTKEIEDPVEKNKLPLLRTLYSGRHDVRIFSHLFIANQTRVGDLYTFFSHKNSAIPPSLACDVKIRF